MKTFLNFAILLSIMILTGCSSDDDPDCGCTVVSRSITFSIKNIEGEDLLNPDNPNAINSSEIRLFYLIDGEAEEVYNADMDAPRGYRVYYHESEQSYVIGISQNSTETEQYPITYVRWNEADFDTLKAEYRREKGLLLVTKTWLNEELIWDINDGTDSYYELVK